MELNLKIVYNMYSMRGNFISEREYVPKDWQDYNEVMEIIEKNPDVYELVNVFPNDDKRSE